MRSQLAFLPLFLIFLLLRPSTSATSFPSLPSQFRARILGQYYLPDGSTGTFAIEQSYLRTAKGETIKRSVFTSEKFNKGTIVDSSKKSTLVFNFSTCFWVPTEISEFASFGITVTDGLTFQLVDALQLFQNADEISLTNVTADGTQFIHNSSDSVPFNVTALVSSEPFKLEKVTIESSEDWRVTLLYDQLLPLADASYVSTPPHGVLCRSQDKEKRIPPLDPFYTFQLRIISQYYTDHDTAESIQVAEYRGENLTSIGFYADTARPIHYTSVVQNSATGRGWKINRETEICQQYSLLPRGAQFPNSSTADKLYVEQVLEKLSLYDKNYLALFWQVWSMVREETSWQYQGTRLLDSAHVEVWSYPLLKSWIAELAFTMEEVSLREGGYSNTRRQVPFNIDLYRVHARANAGPALSFRLSSYHIDSSSASVEMLFDTSPCYRESSSTVVQFRLDIGYSLLYNYGLGGVKRAVRQSLSRWLKLDSDQVQGVQLSPSPTEQTLVTLTIYHGLHTSHFSTQLLKDQLGDAIDKHLYVTFTDSSADHVQLAYSVPGSLTLDYQNELPARKWSISITATVSVSLATLFIGILLGAFSFRVWNTRCVNARSVRRCSPNYKKFTDEEDTVNIGSV